MDLGSQLLSILDIMQFRSPPIAPWVYLLMGTPGGFVACCSFAHLITGSTWRSPRALFVISRWPQMLQCLHAPCSVLLYRRKGYYGSILPLCRRDLYGTVIVVAFSLVLWSLLMLNIWVCRFLTFFFFLFMREFKVLAPLQDGIWHYREMFIILIGEGNLPYLYTLYCIVSHLFLCDLLTLSRLLWDGSPCD